LTRMPFHIEGWMSRNDIDNSPEIRDAFKMIYGWEKTGKQHSKSKSLLFDFFEFSQKSGVNSSHDPSFFGIRKMRKYKAGSWLSDGE